MKGGKGVKRLRVEMKRMTRGADVPPTGQLYSNATYLITDELQDLSSH